MKICHVCKAECDEKIELCPVCGADLSDYEEVEEIVEAEVSETEEKTEKTITNPVLLVSLDDVVSAEIFKDILTTNDIPYACSSESSGTMRVVFGGGLASDDIYVDSSDLEKANELYAEFLESEPEFSDEFFEGEFEEEE